MGLEIKKIENGNKVTLQIKGMINTDTVSVLNKVLEKMNFNDIDLTFDFINLSYITSVGLRTLLTVRKKLQEEKIRIIGMNEAVYDVFRMSGFLDFFPIEAAKSSYLLPEDPSFQQLLTYRVATDPGKKILFCDDKSYTWNDIDQASQIVAGDFFNLGVRKGSHIGMFARNTFNWAAAFYAAQKLGAITVLLNYSLKPEEVKQYSQYGDIDFLCYDTASAKMDYESFRDAVTGADSNIKKLYDISANIDFLARKDELDELEGRFTEEFNSDDPCIMIFTSGTTGRPKGVLSSARDRVINSGKMNDGFNLNENDKILLFLPLCHVFGFGSGLNTSIIRNIPLYMPSDISDKNLLEIIEKEKITLFNSVPTKILSMASSEYFDSAKADSLRVSVIAGSAITAPQMLGLKEKLPYVHFVSLYGMSELAPISKTEYDDTVEHITGTVGKPVKDVKVEIRDHVSGERKKTGEIGELYVKSENSLICYYRMDLDMQAINDEGWIPTGDLGFIDEEGYIHLTGRCKDLIIWGGENISPKEVEEVISQVEGIHDVKVVGVPDEKYGEIVAAAIVMSEGKSFDREKTNAHVLEHLAKYKAPSYYVLYDKFPLLSNGKIDMVNLKKEVADKRGSDEAL